MSGAILGGSRRYGEPREDSDTDLVILVSEEEGKVLCQQADEPKTKQPWQKSCSLRFGKLNIILCTDETYFKRWEEGITNLLKNAPVTREQAIAEFLSLGATGYEA